MKHIKVQKDIQSSNFEIIENCICSCCGNEHETSISLEQYFTELYEVAEYAKENGYEIDSFEYI